jgi:hypothetical protein
VENPIQIFYVEKYFIALGFVVKNVIAALGICDI